MYDIHVDVKGVGKRHKMCLFNHSCTQFVESLKEYPEKYTITKIYYFHSFFGTKIQLYPVSYTRNSNEDFRRNAKHQR